MKKIVIKLLILFAVLINPTFITLLAEDNVGANATNQQQVASSGLQVSGGETSERPELDDGFNVWRSVGAMIFILAGLLAVNVYLKKRYDGSISNSDNKLIKCLETMSVDQRRKIMLLEVEGQKVLVGVSADRMDSLADLKSEDRGQRTEAGAQRSES